MSTQYRGIGYVIVPFHTLHRAASWFLKARLLHGKASREDRDIGMGADGVLLLHACKLSSIMQTASGEQTSVKASKILLVNIIPKYLRSFLGKSPVDECTE